jgi:hypothetical protein
MSLAYPQQNQNGLTTPTVHIWLCERRAIQHAIFTKGIDRFDPNWNKVTMTMKNWPVKGMRMASANWYVVTSFTQNGDPFEGTTRTTDRIVWHEFRSRILTWRQQQQDALCF